MAIDTVNERLSLINWVNEDGLPQAGGSIDQADAFFIIGLPAVDLVPAAGGGNGSKVSSGIGISIG